MDTYNAKLAGYKYSQVDGTVLQYKVMPTGEVKYSLFTIDESGSFECEIDGGVMTNHSMLLKVFAVVLGEL